MDEIAPEIYRSVFERSPVGGYLLSPSEDPLILAVNEAFLRASRRTRESLVGKRLFEVFAGDPSDPGDTGVDALRASLARAIATGRPDALPLQRYPILVSNAGKDPVFEERYWRVVNVPIADVAGRLVCIAHRTEDVTEQTRIAQALQRSAGREAFQLAFSDRLRALTSPDEIAATATAALGQWLEISRVTYVEVDAATDSFVQRHWMSSGGVQPPSERRQLEEFGGEIVDTLRRGHALVINDVQTDPRTRAHAAAYASIGVRSNLAIPLVKADSLSMVLSLQHDQPRTWNEAEIELARDVAERAWDAAENARAQEELREANRRKDEFLAMLAHELRNPLAPISAAAELLAHSELDAPRLRRTSEIIARQVRHMTGLVDDLLDVSRVTRGVVALDESPQDMKAVLANAAEQVRPLMEAHRHHLSLDLAPVPAVVCGDGKRLVQVISNLLNNSAKFTPAGGYIQVSLAVERQQVRVRVKDDGIGIPRELQPRVFDLFSQAERSPDRSQGGLGLGLALVKSLVERHHGSVSVYSEGPGAGSCFTVTLPLLEAPANAPPAAAPASAHVDGRGTDVLIVDDNEDAAEMLKVLLESIGYRVRVANNPHRALEAAAQEPPRVGLIDIGLPSMDGYELVRRLKASAATAATRYVALTGYGQASDRQLALDSGFDEHLVKPADPRTLMAVLDRLAHR